MNLFNSIINIFGLVASILSVLIIFGLSFKRSSLIKRVSLQLQTGIALLDITRHVQLHVFSNSDDPNLCAFIAFFGFFADQLYVLFNVAIALNLHLFLLNQYNPKPLIRWFYFVASIGLSAITNVIPLVFGYLGKNSGGFCYIKGDVANRKILKLLMVHIPYWPGIIYCLTIFVLVFHLYYIKGARLIDLEVELLPEVIHLGWTISLYSLTCFTTMFLYLLDGILFDWLSLDSSVFDEIALFGLCCTGSLNLLCLLLDYQIWEAICDTLDPEKPLIDSDFELPDNSRHGQNSTYRPGNDVTLATKNHDEDFNYRRENLINFL